MAVELGVGVSIKPSLCRVAAGNAIAAASPAIACHGATRFDWSVVTTLEMVAT